VAKDSTHNKYYFPATNTVVLVLNVTKAPFNDVKVRQAVSAAINRTELSQVGETNYEPVATSSSGLLLPEFTAQVPVGPGQRPVGDLGLRQGDLRHDRGRLRQGLPRASWAKGGKGGVVLDRGPRPRTRTTTPAATLISQELKPLGFKGSRSTA